MGVWLVLALDLIRKTAKDCGQVVGPILALSYKNHALDEFLSDVVRAPSIILHKHELIRCGRTEHESLQRFKETNSAQEKNADTHLQDLVAVFRRTHRTCRDWKTTAQRLSGLNETKYAQKHLHDLSAALLLYHDVSSADNLSKSVDTADDRAVEELHEAFAQLETVGKRDRSVNLLQLLPGIAAGAEHWRPVQQSDLEDQFLLHQWLAGQCPPPRCKGTSNSQKTQCMNYADTGHNSSFCTDTHRCRVDQCGKPRNGHAMHCPSHRCLSRSGDECKLPRVNGEFCSLHHCPSCVKDGKDIKERREHVCAAHECQVEGCADAQEYRRKFCQRHICCTELCGEKKSFDGCKFCEVHRCKAKQDLCTKAALPPSVAYCVDHTCEQCFASLDPQEKGDCTIHPLCTFVEINGEECPAFRVKDGLYCRGHLEKTAAPTTIQNQFCLGKTKKKIPCRAMVTAAEGYCQAHIMQRPEIYCEEYILSVTPAIFPNKEEEGQEKQIESVKIAALSQEEVTYLSFSLSSLFLSVFLSVSLCLSVCLSLFRSL